MKCLKILRGPTAVWPETKLLPGSRAPWTDALVTSKDLTIRFLFLHSFTYVVLALTICRQITSKHLAWTKKTDFLKVFLCFLCVVVYESSKLLKHNIGYSYYTSVPYFDHHNFSVHSVCPYYNHFHSQNSFAVLCTLHLHSQIYIQYQMPYLLFTLYHLM